PRSWRPTRGVAGAVRAVAEVSSVVVITARRGRGAVTAALSTARAARRSGGRRIASVASASAALRATLIVRGRAGRDRVSMRAADPSVARVASVFPVRRADREGRGAQGERRRDRQRRDAPAGFPRALPAGGQRR